MGLIETLHTTLCLIFLYWYLVHSLEMCSMAWIVFTGVSKSVLCISIITPLDTHETSDVGYNHSGGCYRIYGSRVSHRHDTSSRSTLQTLWWDSQRS
ncbi:hypothetical protein BC629DRAFT_1167078 [Irpex lacteus]|nr:hypothetical protein BC629DRAFT_1167078 [Irpex lacteus]